MLHTALLLLTFIVLLLLVVVLGGPNFPPETDSILDEVLKDDLSHVVSGQTGYANAGGVTIWYEDLSPVGSPRGTILLNMSMAADALIWPSSFVHALTDAGYRVIRYDYRGTGMSDWMKEWDNKHPYTFEDMVDDAIAVLDERKVERAHLIGLSLGGMVAQEIAIRNSDRVSSLTLMSTSGYAGDPNLPNLSMSYFLTSFLQGLPLLKYRLMGGEKNLIKERIGRMIAAGIEVDIRETAELVLYDLRERKGVNLRALSQHRAATDASGSRYDKLKTLTVPTLIIHGTNDKLLPIEHGQKLAELLPNAEYVQLEGVGHMFPYPKMGELNQRIIDHMGAAK